MCPIKEEEKRREKKRAYPIVKLYIPFKVQF
jgi:hypothetical protein